MSNKSKNEKAEVEKSVAEENKNAAKSVPDAGKPKEEEDNDDDDNQGDEKEAA